jgi:hypothetical protein
VHHHDRLRARSDRGFNFCLVNVQSIGANIDKYGSSCQVIGTVNGKKQSLGKLKIVILN